MITLTPQVQTHLEKYDYFNSSSANFVQVIHVTGNRWVCASNLISPPGTVYVYDSLPPSSINCPTLHKQRAVIVKSIDFAFTIKHISVQCQFGGNDCGVFAIAFATSLCMGVYPYMLKCMQTQTRAQLLRGLESGYLSPSTLLGKHTDQEGNICCTQLRYQYFVCRLPWSKNDREYITHRPLVQRLLCMEWHHQICCNIDDVVLGKPREKYLCNICNV